MTSEDADVPPWDFKEAHRLLTRFRYSYSEETYITTSALLDPTTFDPTINKPQNLGDFNRLFKFLGQPVVNFNTFSDSDTTTLSLQSDSSARLSSSSSISSDAVHFDDFVVRGKEVRFTDNIDGIPLEQFESENEPSHKRSSSRKSSARRQPHNLMTLRPSALDFITRPKSDGNLWSPPPSTPRIEFDPMVIRPKESLTHAERMSRLADKLARKFPHKRSLLNLNLGLPLELVGGNESPDGIHVFVDCSNIVIGFHETLKLKRGINLKAYTTAAPMSWQALAIILERGRKIARRIVVGSNRTPEGEEPAKLPEYLLEAERCHYELNILDRVAKFKDPALTRTDGGNGYSTTSGLSSGSNRRRKQWTEQGVDEILHMKMLESIVDTEHPATMVLATGDAAKAEYSGGFLENVERALRIGWKVELVSWRKGLSREYERLKNKSKWKGEFKIIELDDFSEELLAIYRQSTRCYSKPLP